MSTCPRCFKEKKVENGKWCKGCRRKDYINRLHPDRQLIRYINRTVKVFSKKYGVPTEGAKLLIKRRFGICALCGEFAGNKALVVDHCHKTGKVRGMIHQRCNTILGLAHDDIKMLRCAIEYLERFID